MTKQQRQWQAEDRKSDGKIATVFVACPTCESKRWAPCYTPKGNATRTHTARITLYKEDKAIRKAGR